MAIPSNPSARWRSNFPSPSPKITGGSSAHAPSKPGFALGQNGALGSLVTPDRNDPAQLPIDEALSQARTWLAKSENFQLLALYEQRIHRAIEKNMAERPTQRAECK
jgi:hypothetical protein